jgi:rhomboid family GlyGly-CTERM serine protease
MKTLSAGRLAAPLFFAGLCFAIYQSPALSAALELGPAQLLSEPWRLATGHLTHWSAEHLAWDLLVFLALAVLFPPRRLWTLLGATALAIGLGVVFLHPEIAAYRGLSGLDSALFAALALDLTRHERPHERWLGRLALILFSAKILAELFGGQALFAAGPYVPLPVAHLLGLFAALAEALLSRRSGFAIMRRDEPSKLAAVPALRGDRRQLDRRSRRSRRARRLPRLGQSPGRAPGRSPGRGALRQPGGARAF